MLQLPSKSAALFSTVALGPLGKNWQNFRLLVPFRARQCKVGNQLVSLILQGIAVFIEQNEKIDKCLRALPKTDALSS
jgi:hypothetical protein